MEVESTNKKWVAGAGTTALGIIGTALGGLNAVNGGGLLNGLGNGNGNGKGCNETDKLRSEIAQLNAERYTDAAVIAANKETVNNLKDFYGRFEVAAGKLSRLEVDYQCLQKQLTDYAIHQKEIDDLQRALLRKDIEGVGKDLNCLAGKVEAMGTTFANRLNGIDALIGSFTATVVKESAICDTGCGCKRACGQ
jgi:hypothetical protein